MNKVYARKEVPGIGLVEVMATASGYGLFFNRQLQKQSSSLEYIMSEFDRL